MKGPVLVYFLLYYKLSPLLYFSQQQFLVLLASYSYMEYQMILILPALHHDVTYKFDIFTGERSKRKKCCGSLLCSKSILCSSTT